MLILSINLLMVIDLKDPSDVEKLDGGTPSIVIFWILKAMQLILSIVVAFSYLLETYPVLI